MYHIKTDEYKLGWLIRILYPLQNFPDFVNRIQAQIAFNCPVFSPNNQPQKYKDFGNQSLFYGFFPFFSLGTLLCGPQVGVPMGKKRIFATIID